MRPAGWREVALHEISRPRQWQTIPMSSLTDEGHLVYGANGVIGRYHSFNHAERTILIGCRGTCGVVNVSEPNSWVTGNAMALDELDTSSVDLGYLVHALRKDGLQRAVTGSSQPQITQTSLKRITIPLPPIDEQRHIAEVLDAADGLREARSSGLLGFELLLNAYFVELFGHPEGPATWPTHPIGEIADVITGNTPPRSSAENYGADFEWLKSDNILESGDISPAVERLSASGRVKAREAPAGATLVVCIAGSPRSIGRAGLLDRSAAFNQQINAVVPGPGLLPEFMFRLLRINQYRVQRASTSSMKGMVSKSALAAIEVAVPPIEEQARYVDVAHQVHEAERKARTALEKAEALCGSLQDRAFRGEL